MSNAISIISISRPLGRAMCKNVIDNSLNGASADHNTFIEWNEFLIKIHFQSNSRSLCGANWPIVARSALRQSALRTPQSAQQQYHMVVHWPLMGTSAAHYHLSWHIAAASNELCNIIGVKPLKADWYCVYILYKYIYFNSRSYVRNKIIKFKLKWCEFSTSREEMKKKCMQAVCEAVKRDRPKNSVKTCRMAWHHSSIPRAYRMQVRYNVQGAYVSFGQTNRILPVQFRKK